MGYDITPPNIITPWGEINCKCVYGEDIKELKPMEKPTVYKINEIFESIQGEGYYSGTPVIFIRLAGCSMGCEWCDTKYCQEVHYSLTTEQIMAHLEKNFVKKRVVITGGEPFEQDLKQLVKTLAHNGYEISIETNGAQEISSEVSTYAWITVSPKKTVLSDSLKKAGEIKLVITDEKDIQRAKRIASYYHPTYFYLQPESGKAKSTQLCVKTCLEDPRFKLSAQLHKLINVK